jgi:D-aspartate ligase
MNEPIPVVIGAGYNAYSLVRALGEHGVRSAVACRGRGQALFSRYVCRRWPLPSADPSPESMAAMEAYAARMPRPGLLMPTSEDWVRAILTQSQRLGRSFLLPTHEPQAVRLAIDKIAMNQWCLQNGVRVPAMLSFMPGQDWGAFVRAVAEHLPLVVKPQTKGVNDKSLGFFYRQFDEPTVLTDWAGKQGPAGPACGVLCQQLIPGPVENLISFQGYVSRSGQLHMAGYTKLRQTPPVHGCASAARVRATWEAARATADIIRRLGHRGQFDLEFKRSDRDGKLYFIEVNPRAGMLNYAAELCGVSVAYLEYLDACGLPLPPPRTVVRSDWVWLRLLDDFASHTVYYRRYRPPRHTPLGRYARSLLSGRPMDPCLNLHDPGVLVATVVHWARACLSHVSGGGGPPLHAQ